MQKKFSITTTFSFFLVVQNSFGTKIPFQTFFPVMKSIVLCVQKWVPPLCKFHSAKKKYCGALYGIFMSKNFLTFATKCNLKPDALSKTLNILHPNFLFCRRDLVVCNLIPGGDWENFAGKQCLYLFWKNTCPLRLFHTVRL